MFHAFTCVGKVIQVFTKSNGQSQSALHKLAIYAESAIEVTFRLSENIIETGYPVFADYHSVGGWIFLLPVMCFFDTQPARQDADSQITGTGTSSS